MKTILEVLKHLIAPLLFTIFMFAGFLSAFISGVFEYVVFKNLLVSIHVGNNVLANSTFIPLIVILIFETSKVFLHYKQRRLELSEQYSINNELKQTKLLKNVLVGISITCTILFVLATLQAVNPDNQNSAIAHEQEKAFVRLNASLEVLKEKTIDKIESETKLASDLLKAERDQYDRLIENPVYTPKVSYDRYLTQLKESKERISTLTQEYDIALKNARDKFTAEEVTTANALKSNYDTEIQAINSNLKYKASNDNIFIQQALLIFTDDKGYSRELYYFIIVIISVIIALVLEAIIAVTQNIIGNDDYNYAIYSSKGTIQDLTKYEKPFSVILSTILASTCFIIINAIREITFVESIMFNGFLAYLLSYSILSIFGLHNFKKSKSDNETQKSFNLNTIAKESTTLIIHSGLAFAAYLVIGLIFGNLADGFTISSSGIALGSLANGFLRKAIS